MQPKWKRAQDEQVVPASHSAGCDGAKADVGDLVNHEVQDGSWQCLALTGMRSEREGWAEGQLLPEHSKNRLWLGPIQEPGPTNRLDGVDARFWRAVQLPIHVVKLQHDRAGLILLGWPIHGDDMRDAASEEKFGAPVNVICECNGHADTKRQHSTKITCVSIVVTKPLHLCLLSADICLQDLCACLVSGHRPSQGGSRGSRVLLCTHLVDFVPGIIVRDNHLRVQELLFLQALVMRICDDAVPGFALVFIKLAPLHGLAVEVLVISIREVP